MVIKKITFGKLHPHIIYTYTVTTRWIENLSVSHTQLKKNFDLIISTTECVRSKFKV